MFNPRKGLAPAMVLGLLAAAPGRPAQGASTLVNGCDAEATVMLGPTRPAKGLVHYQITGLGQPEEKATKQGLLLHEPDGFKPIVLKGWHTLVLAMESFEGKPLTLDYQIQFKNGISGETMAFEVLHKSRHDDPVPWKSIPELFLNKGGKDQSLGFHRLVQRSDTELVFTDARTRQPSVRLHASPLPALPSIREDSETAASRTETKAWVKEEDGVVCGCTGP